MRKQAIMEKAVELFAKQGIEATSIQQITDYCGISKGAFYLSFKSKNELIISIIDYFMEVFISEIDHVVKSSKKENLLYSFYYTIIQMLNKHSSFGKIIINEPSLFIKDELIEKASKYNTLFDNTILSIVEQLYHEQIDHLKYELSQCIKGFINMYSEILFFKDLDDHINIDLLTRSLVEKTNILAKHMKTVFITEDLFYSPSLAMEKGVNEGELLTLIHTKIEEVEDPISKESLILIKEHFEGKTLRAAIIAGLIENLQKDRHCKWIAFLLRNYFL